MHEFVIVEQLGSISGATNSTSPIISFTACVYIIIKFYGDKNLLYLIKYVSYVYVIMLEAKFR